MSIITLIIISINTSITIA